MSSAFLDDLLDAIRAQSNTADLRQQLDWLDQIAEELLRSGSRYTIHNAFHPGALNELRPELQRLSSSHVGPFLRNKLERELLTLARSPAREAAEQLVVSSSFVLSTLVDMMQNPEQPFEITALLYENQAMFDDWFDQLTIVIGLASYA